MTEAQAEDMSRAVGAARVAFDEGPWPTMSHSERAQYLTAIAAALRERADDLAQIWPRQSGVIFAVAQASPPAIAGMFDFYAGLASSFPFQQRVQPTAGGEFGLLVREPVGAVIPWNGPLLLIAAKIAPALLAGCTVVLKPFTRGPG